MAVRALLFRKRRQHATNRKFPAYSQLKKVSDEDLMEALKQGYQDALAVLFDRYHRLVLSIALRILHDAAEAEDLMQEVFLEIYRAVGSFNREKGTTKGWIVQYAYHRSINRWHYLNVRKFYDRKDISEVESHMTLSSSNTWGKLTLQECSLLIQQGMSSLNGKQRRTLELVCFRGFSLIEVADQMGESLANIRHHYYRGIQKLRKLLQSGPALETTDALPTQECIHGKP